MRRRRPRPPHGDVHRRRCRPTTAAADRATAPTPSPPAPACARSTSSPTRTSPTQDIVLRLYRGTTLVGVGRHADHARADPLRAGGRRARRATTSSRCASSATARRRSSRARTAARSRSTTARRRRRTPRAGATSRATPLHNTLAMDPWNNPDTDIREDWCWKASANAADCDEVVGNLAVARAVGPRRQGEHADEHDDRQQRPHGGVVDEPERPRRRRSSGPSARRATTRSRSRTRGATPTATPGTPYGAAFVPGQSFDIAAVGHEPVRAAQPDARLVLPARLHRGELERPGRPTSARPRRSARTTPVLGSAQAGAAVPPPLGYARRAQQREHVDAARRLAVDHEHVPVAARGGRVLPALRRRRLRRRRDRPRVRPHDREPHDRQGRPPHRPSRGRDGRVGRRPDVDRAAQRARQPPDRRREPLGDRHVRHRQQAARHPQPRGQLAGAGRVPDAGRRRRRSTRSTSPTSATT